MSNSYFQFKQFMVRQDQCAMKVSTDACIQGAWAAVPAPARKALDIGAGTGLLSLMLAQRFPDLHIDALELDPAAAGQAAENIANSPFSGRIRVIQGDARTALAENRYDYIICNPPFFTGSLKGNTVLRNQARHDDALTQQDLMSLLQQWLTADGMACFLWPSDRQETWGGLLAGNGLQLHHQLNVRDRDSAKITRVVSVCGRKAPAALCTMEELIIKQDAAIYSASFSGLLEPFYLHL